MCRTAHSNEAPNAHAARFRRPVCRRDEPHGIGERCGDRCRRQHARRPTATETARQRSARAGWFSTLFSAPSVPELLLALTNPHMSSCLCIDRSAYGHRQQLIFAIARFRRTGHESCPGRPGRIAIFIAVSAYSLSSFTWRSRSALPTTDTDDRLIAAAANIGDSRMPKNGNRTPAATGTPTEL